MRKLFDSLISNRTNLLYVMITWEKVIFIVGISTFVMIYERRFIFGIFFPTLFLLFVPFTVFAEPKVNDPDLMVELVVKGIIDKPTSLHFVGDNLFVLEKDSGKVYVIKNGTLGNPVLDVNVWGYNEYGLLGITSVGSTVYLYFTESKTDFDLLDTKVIPTSTPLATRIYKYDWNGTMLVNPVLVKELPVGGGYHIGGVLITTPNEEVLAVIGDVGVRDYERNGILQNVLEGDPADDTSVILQVDPPGKYYAMGIRNSFGLAIDPVTGYLWDTENGPDYGDEINLVFPGFNSGWKKVMGHSPPIPDTVSIPNHGDFVYSDPEFSWEIPVAPTGLTFIDSPHFPKYHDSLFVAAANTGYIYNFKLNEERTGFLISEPTLADLEQNPDDDISEIIFAEGLVAPIDLEFGPDGYLYLTSIGNRAIYRILPIDDFLHNTWTQKENLQRQFPEVGEGNLENLKEYAKTSGWIPDSSLSEQIPEDTSVKFKKQCKTGFVQMIKSSNGSEACVKPSTAEVLIKRGWGTLVN